MATSSRQRAVGGNRKVVRRVRSQEETTLERTTLRTSRLLDFLSARELTAQIGHPPPSWPLVLVKELVTIGLTDAFMDGYGYVVATLPSNTTRDVPTIGLIAHMDTSPDVSGEDVKPQLHENYDGGDIRLPGDGDVVIRTAVPRGIGVPVRADFRLRQERRNSCSISKSSTEPW